MFTHFFLVFRGTFFFFPYCMIKIGGRSRPEGGTHCFIYIYISPFFHITDYVLIVGGHSPLVTSRVSPRTLPSRDLDTSCVFHSEFFTLKLGLSNYRGSLRTLPSQIRDTSCVFHSKFFILKLGFMSLYGILDL